MADESRAYPPTERRLAQLWAAGAHPASRALTGAAVLAAAWLVLLAFASPAMAWGAGLVRHGLEVAAVSADAPAAAGELVLHGALIIAIIVLIPFTVALLVQVAQRGSAPKQSSPGMPGGRGSGARHDFEGVRAVRGVLMVALGAAAVAAAVRGVMCAASGILHAEDPVGAAGMALTAIGWPLLLVVIGAAVLDARLEREAWRKSAWMTRRELEQELRETEGHHLNRERRGTMIRGRRHA